MILRRLLRQSLLVLVELGVVVEPLREEPTDGACYDSSPVARLGREDY